MSRFPRRLSYGEEATLAEHLEELRWRIFVVLGALVAGTIVAFVFHGHILDWLNHPLPADRRKVTTFGVVEPFTVTIMVSMYAGLVLSLPVLIWQTWSFFMPAVEPGIEKRLLALVAAAIGLGAGGLAFGYWILLPRAIHFLTHYDDRHFQHFIQAKPYYSFVTTVLLGIIVVFQLPLVVLGLVALGAMSSTALRRNRRLGYFIVAVIALALPGPDPVTTGLELLPMWVLFEGSIWVAVLFERRRRRTSALATLDA